jgi:autotransporter-associated beta strand protein
VLAVAAPTDASAQSTCPTISTSNTIINLSGVVAAPCTVTGTGNTITLDSTVLLAPTTGIALSVSPTVVGPGTTVTNYGTIGSNSQPISIRTFMTGPGETTNFLNLTNYGLIINQIAQTPNPPSGSFGQGGAVTIINKAGARIEFRTAAGLPGNAATNLILNDTSLNNSRLNTIVRNEGTIIGSLSLGQAPDLVINSGTIDGYIDFGNPGARKGTLVLREGWSISGAVSSQGSTLASIGSRTPATLSLSGGAGTSSSLDVSQIGAYSGATSATPKFQGFSGFVKEGASTWTLTGSANTAYRPASGVVPEWWISGGRLSASTAALPWNVRFGGRLALEGATGFLAGDPDFQPTAGAAAILEWNQATDATYAGTISQCNAVGGDCAVPIVGSVVKTGAGTLTLTGANTYSGGTTLTQGALAIASDGALGAASAPLTLNGGTLRTTTSISTTRPLTVALASGIDTTLGTLTLGTGLAGSGALTKSGSGTLTLAAAGSYSGELTLAQGTLRLGATGALGSGTLRTTGSVLDYADGVTNTAPIILDSNSTQLQVALGSATQAGAITEAGGARPLEKIGAGVLTLTGTNSYTGATSIVLGKLQIGGLGSIAPTSAVNIAAPGDLGFDLAASSAFSNSITGSGAIAQYGLGAVTLTGDSAGFTGTTTVFGGSVLQVDGALGGATQVLPGATLRGGGSLGSATIQNGGILAPGSGSSPGTLGFQNLTLAPSAATNFRLASAGDRVVVANNFTLDGTANFSGTVPSGVYRLFDYSPSGGFTDNGLALGTLPTGSMGTLKLAPGQVNLALSLNGQVLQFWDGANLAPGAGTAAGGSGVWNAANSNWTSVVGNTNAAWAGEVGIFGGASGTVSVEGSQAVQGLQFVTDGYVLTPASAGQLALQGDAQGDTSASFINVDAGVTAGIAAPLSGSKGLNKLGLGKLVLSGASSYSGTTTVAEGVLNVRNAAALGAASAGTVVTNGAALEIEGDIALVGEPLTLAGSGPAGAGALRSISGANSLAGGVTLAAPSRINTDTGTLVLSGVISGAGQTLTVGGAGATTISGVIATGSGGLTKDGAGTLTLSGLNSYTGATLINDGSLDLNQGGILSASAVTIGDGLGLPGSARLSINDVVPAQPLVVTLAADGVLIQGDLALLRLASVAGSAGELRLASMPVAVQVLELSGTDASSSFGGIVAGGAPQVSLNPAVGTSLIKVGPTTQTFSGANTYSARTFIGGGSLRAASNTALGDAGADSGTLVYGVGSLELANNITVAERIYLNGNGNGGTGALRNFAGSNVLTGNVTLGWAGGSVTARDAAIGAEAGSTLTISGDIDGTKALTKVGAGSVVLAGTGTWAGGTTLSGGTLRLGAANALPNATRLTFGGGTLDLNGFSRTVSDLSGTGGILLGNATLTVAQTTAGSFTGPIDGSGALVKTGAAELGLTGPSSYQGGTTITQGSVSIGADSALGAASGTLGLNGGTLRTTADVAMSRAVTVNAASGIDTASGTLTLAGVLAGGSALEKSGAGTLVLAGANTYTGATTVSAGVLRAGASGTNGQAFGLGSAVTLANVAGAALDLNGSNQSIGSLAGGGALGGGVALGGGTLTTGSDNSSTTYAGSLSGAGGLTKTGSGTLVLSGTNSHGGLTTVAAGALNVRNAAALGAADGMAASGTVVNSGAALELQGGVNLLASNEALTLSGSGIAETGALRSISGSNAIGGGGTVTLTGDTLIQANGGSSLFVANFVGNGTLTLGGAGDVGVQNLATSSGGLTKIGSGTAQISGANNAYEGLTLIKEGTLRVSAYGGGSLGSTLNGTVVESGATLQLDGPAAMIVGEALTLAGNGVGGQGALRAADLAGDIHAPIILAADSRIGAYGTATLNLHDKISGAGRTLTFVGDAEIQVRNAIDTGSGGVVMEGDTFGYVELKGVNDYTGTTEVRSGTLVVTGGSSITDTGVVRVTGGTLGFRSNETIGSLEGTAAGSVALNNATLTIGGNNASTSFAGTISDGHQAVPLVGALAKIGSGTLTLTGVNDYIGGTRIDAGVLAVPADSALGAAAGSVTFGGGSLRALADFSSARAVTLEAAGGSFDTTGNQLQWSGPIDGSGALTKLGAGTLTLGGSPLGNTYAGPTDVQAGTLGLRGGIALADTAAVNVAAGARLNLESSETIGSLTSAGAIDGAGQTLTAATYSFSAGTVNANLGGGTLLQTGPGTTTLTGSAAVTQVNITGGTLLLGAAERLANGAALTINAGSLDLGGYTQTLGSLAGSGGIVQIGNGNLTVGSNNANTAYAGALGGSGSLTKTGLGTLQLNGNSAAYGGSTSVDAGTLQVDGTLGGSGASLSVAAAATLSGTGTVGGATTVQASGILSPGTSSTAGTLNFTHLTLQSGAVVNYQLGSHGVVGGPNNDFVNVSGNLSLDGATLNITNAAPSGVYRVFDYGGSLSTSGSGLTVGTKPTSLGNIFYASGQVNLLLSNGGQRVQFWDGPNNSANGSVEGGSGIWSATTNTNWTDAAGFANGPWESQVGVFGGSAGTVTVEGAQSLQGIQFTTGGYTLMAGAAGQLQLVGDAQGNTNASFINVDSGLSATIGAPLVGAKGLDKKGDGSLTLNGANSFSGLTDVQSGTLALAGGSAIADSGAVNVAAGATLNLLASETIGSVSSAGTIDGSGKTLTASTYSFAGGTVNANLGSGTLTQTGPGTTTLNGTAAAASVDITGGRLLLGAAERLASSAALNIDGGSFDLGGYNQTTGALGGTGGTVELGSGTLTTGTNNASTAYAGGINGVGTLTKFGTGTLTLSGANSFSGLTNVQSGTLALAGGSAITDSGAVNVAAGATLNLLASETIGSVSSAGTIDGSGKTLTASTYSFAGGTVNANLGDGTLTQTGPGTTTLNGTAAAAHVDVLGGTLLLGGNQRLASSAALNIDGGSFDLGGYNQTTGALAGTGGTVELGSGTLTTGTNNASTAYAGGINGVGTLTKFGTGTLTLSGANSFSGLTNVQSGTLALAGGSAIADSGAVNVAAGATLNLLASETIGSVSSAGTIDGSGKTLTASTYSFAGGTVNANLGGGTLTQTGPGTTTLNGTAAAANVNITGGTLLLGAAERLASSAALTVGGGSFDLGGFAQTTGPVTLASGSIDNGTLQGDGYAVQSGSIGAQLGGGGSLTKTTAGTVTLTGNNSYSGGTIISSGSLRVGAGGSLGAIVGAVSNDGALIFDRADAVVFGGAISGSGTLTQAGASQLTLTGNNSYSGGTTIAAGSLRVGVGGSSGAIVGDVTNDGALIFNRAGELNFGGAIGGSGSLTQAGPGTLRLTGTNSYTGGTTVSGGTLALAADGALGGPTGALTLAGGTLLADASFASARTLTVGAAAAIDTGANTLTLNGALAGSAALLKQGSGTLVAAGDGSGYQGAASVAAGRLQVDDRFGGAGANLDIAAGATLGGTGVIGGTTHIADGGQLNPGGLTSPGTLTFDSLKLSPNAVLNYRLDIASGAGAASDRAVVRNDFTLDGVVNVLNPVARSGVYRLFGYNSAGGSFNNQGLAIGTVPAGSTAFVGLTPGAVSLVLARSGQSLQFWNGPNTSATGSVAGGDGLWRSALTNWTDITGQASVAWNAQIGVFSAAAGTVTVEGAQAFQGLQFASDGYRLLAGHGGSLTLLGDAASNPAASFVNVDAGVTATIGAPLAGSKGLEKLGAGTLVLAGTSSYSGGTTIAQGTLAIKADAALGAAGGALVLAGGTLQTTDDISMQRGVQVTTAAGIDTASGTLALGSGLAGGGALLKSGSGTLTLTAAGSYSGELTLAAGTLALDATGALGSGSLRTTGSVVAYADAVTNAAPIVLASNTTQLQVASGSAIQAGAISADAGARPLEKTGAGTLVLTGANHYGGPTTISAGTLVADAASLSGDVDLRGTLRFAQATDADYAGRISGNGQWIKEGAGSLNYSGDGSAFVGATQIAAGSLIVNQRLGGRIAVASGATLAGSGQIGRLQLAGTVAPAGNSIGTLTVAGDLTVAAGSRYAVQLRPSAQPVAGSDSDLIAVQGQTTLQGGVVELDPLGGRYRGRVRYTLLTSSGGVNGQFAGVSTTLPSGSPFARYTLGYDADAVWLDLSAGDFADSALTTNQRAVATALDREFVVGPGPLDPLFTALFALPDAASAQTAYDSLSGEVHASALQGVQQANRAFEQTVATRQRSGRGGSWLATAAADAPAAGADGLWVAPIIAGGSVDGDGNASGGRVRDYGVALGYDRQVDDSLRAGVALGGNNARTRLDRSDAGSASYDGFQLGAYLSWRPQRWRIDGQLYGGQQWLRSSRTVAVGSSTESYTASYQVPALGAAVEAAWRLPLDAPVALAPFAGAAYQQLWRPTATESAGTLGAQLALGRQQSSTAPVWVGLESELPVDAGSWRGAVGLRLGWVGQLGNTDQSSEASFALAPATTAMTVYGVPQARSSGLVGLRLDLLGRGNTRFALEYSGVFGGGITSSTGRLAITWAL